MPTRLEDVPAELVVDFDITDPAYASPHRWLSEMQVKTPVAYWPKHGGWWLVTRYSDVEEVATNWEVFSAENQFCPRTGKTGMEDRSVPLEFDPPEHTLYRKLLNPLFSPGRMKILA